MEMKLVGEELGHMGSLLGALWGDEVDTVGASWLHQCPMSFTARGLAALARGRGVALRSVRDESDDIVIEDVCSEEDAFDIVTALQWVEAELLDNWGEGGEGGGGAARALVQDSVLLVGCASGMLRIYDARSNLILSQVLHESGVRRFRLRGFGSPDRTQDLLVLFEDSVVARVDGATIISLLKGRRGGRTAAHLAHCKWKMQSQEGHADAVCCGLDEQAQTSDFWGALYYKLVVGGCKPTLALYAACDERTSTSAKEVLSKVTTAAWSMAKSYFWGGGGGADLSGESLVAAGDSKKAMEPPRMVTACDAFEDPGRQIRSLSLEPQGKLVAASDELGRVLLLDVEDFFVLRMWKGYRESECAWTAVSNGTAVSKGAGGAPEAGVGDADSGKGGRLCLLLYAPRRRILEAWHTGSGSRVGAKRFDASTRLLQAEAPLRELVEDEDDWTEKSNKGSAQDGEDEGGDSEEKELAATVKGEEGGAGGACLTVDVVGKVVIWKVVQVGED